MKLHDTSGKMIYRYRVRNIHASDGRYLFFFSDPPHLIKVYSHLVNSYFVNSHFVNFTSSIPTSSTLTKWELTKWEIDKVGIDKLGIDEFGIDKVGMYTNTCQNWGMQTKCAYSSYNNMGCETYFSISVC